MHKMRMFFLLILSLSFQVSLSQKLLSGSLRSCCEPPSGELFRLNSRLEKRVFQNDTLFLEGTLVIGCGSDTDSLEFRLDRAESDTIHLSIVSTKREEWNLTFCGCEYKFSISIYEPSHSLYSVKIAGSEVPMEKKRYRTDGFKSEKYKLREGGRIIQGVKETYLENGKVLVEVFYRNGIMVSEKFYASYGGFRYERKLN